MIYVSEKVVMTLFRMKAKCWRQKTETGESEASRDSVNIKDPSIRLYIDNNNFIYIAPFKTDFTKCSTENQGQTNRTVRYKYKIKNNRQTKFGRRHLKVGLGTESRCQIMLTFSGDSALSLRRAEHTGVRLGATRRRPPWTRGDRW